MNDISGHHGGDGTNSMEVSLVESLDSLVEGDSVKDVQDRIHGLGRMACSWSDNHDIIRDKHNGSKMERESHSALLYELVRDS